MFLALALTDRTRGLISSIELELMEPAAWLVNVARGEHVVTEDLVVALRDDTIGGAALDVTDPEPLPEGHPLWSLPNCIVTPHTGNTEDMAKPAAGRAGPGEPPPVRRRRAAARPRRPRPGVLTAVCEGVDGV